MPDPKDSGASDVSDVVHALSELDPSAFAMPSVVGPKDDPDAPRLPLSDDEPAPVPAVDPSQLVPDHEALHRLERHKRLRRALTCALAGEPYDDAALPDTRTLVLGLMRVLVQSGVDAEALVSAVADAANT